MKTRVKATGEIIEYRDFLSLPKIIKKIYLKLNDLKFLDLPKNKPDYWEKLKHQHTGMAMQGILANPETTALYDEDIAATAIRVANITIEKLKEESQCEK